MFNVIVINNTLDTLNKACIIHSQDYCSRKENEDLSSLEELLCSAEDMQEWQQVNLSNEHLESSEEKSDHAIRKNYNKVVYPRLTQDEGKGRHSSSTGG